MPNPERVEKKQELTKEEQVLSGVREELTSFVDRFQVENILSELNMFINPSDLWKKSGLVDYICSWKLWSKENEELENMANYIIYWKSLWNDWVEKKFFFLENRAARKLKYILDNYWKNINKILSEIKAKELEMKSKSSSNPSTKKADKQKEEKSALESAFDRVKEWISDVYNYWADKLSALWGGIKSLVPDGVKNWVKDNLFSPEKQKNTENINDIYQKLKWAEKPDFLPFYLAMQWYNKEKGKLWNSKYLTVVDYSKWVSQNRLYVINMETLTIEHCVKTWHWKNSGNTQTTSKFSNNQNSNQTSIGFFRTPAALAQNSKRTWKWLFLNWMEYSNNKADVRWIAVHPVQSFFYSSNGWNRNHTKYHRAWESTSEGCITIRNQDNPGEIMNKIKWDSLIYSYYPDINYLNKSTMIK